MTAAKPHIKMLEQNDCATIASDFAGMGWSKPIGHFEAYLAQQRSGARTVWIAFCDGAFAGYITVVWLSEYPPFAERGIPEIADLNVLPKYRGRGVASCLLDIAEQDCTRRSPVIGIGVGLYAAYGAAQRLYVKRGYVPDGHGVTCNYQPVTPGGAAIVDDELVIWLTKPELEK